MVFIHSVLLLDFMELVLTRSLFLKLSHCQLMSLGVGALGLAEQGTR